MTQVPDSRDGTQAAEDPIVERVVMPFVRESTLWPVLIVLVVILAATAGVAGT